MSLRPSSAHRWIGGGCTASPRACEGIPRKDTDASKEGVRLHEIAADVLQRRTSLKELADDDYEVIAPYVDAVRRIHDETGGVGLWVERGVGCKELGMRGMIDAMVPGTISDLKTGHRPVEVRNNWQLLCYAVLSGHPDGQPIRLQIIQPTVWHPDGKIREWIVDDLAPYRKQIKAAVHLARTAPKFVASSANCTYCPAISTCHAARAASLGAVDLAYRPVERVPAAEMRTELTVLREGHKMLTERLVALEAEAETRLRAGERMSGCGMVPGQRKPLHWTLDSDTVRKRIVEAGGDDPVKPTKLITPKQAMKAGASEKLITEMAERASPSMKLATDTLERARKAFE